MRLQQQFGIVLPVSPRRAAGKDLSLLGIGPDSWLAFRDRADDNWVALLREDLGGLASVCDQSDAYSVLRISGRHVREVLSRLIPIDVHSRVFDVGHVAATQAGHIGTTLWRLDDESDGSPVFEIAVSRSYVASFRCALIDNVRALAAGLAGVADDPPRVRVGAARARS